MTTLNPADVKVGDLISITTTVKVKELGTYLISGPSLSGELMQYSYRDLLRAGRTITLLDRPLPEEPPSGTVVVFRARDGHLTSGTAYQRFARGTGIPCWQSTRRGGDNNSTYTWADILHLHQEADFERIEIGAQS